YIGLRGIALRVIEQIADLGRLAVAGILTPVVIRRAANVVGQGGARSCDELPGRIHQVAGRRWRTIGHTPAHVMDVGCAAGSRLNDAEGALGYGEIDLRFDSAVVTKAISSATTSVPVFVAELDEHFRKIVGSLERRDLLAQLGIVSVQHVNRYHHPGTSSDLAGEREQIWHGITPSNAVGATRGIHLPSPLIGHPIGVRGTLVAL